MGTNILCILTFPEYPNRERFTPEDNVGVRVTSDEAELAKLALDLNLTDREADAVNKFSRR